MTELNSFAKEVLGNLETIKAPLAWIGIADPRLQAAGINPPANNGVGFQEPWDFLVEPENTRLVVSTKTVACVASLCIDGFTGIDTTAASPNKTGGGSVLLEFGRDSFLPHIIGPSMRRFGDLGRNGLGARRWVGIAIPKPNFGLTCMAREVTATPPPYCESPWIVGHEWFVQGLSPEMTEALSFLAK